MSSSEYQFILYSFLVDFVGIVCAFNFDQKWDQTGSILDPKKVIPGSFFSTLRPAASRGAHGPHPAIPKAPQRSPKASTRAIFGALWLKKGGPNASKAVHGWHVEPIFGQDCERMSGGGHFWSNLDIFLFFNVFLWYFLLEFQGQIKSGLKGSDFFSFQFFSPFPCFLFCYPTLPFCQPYLTGGTSAWGVKGR